MELSNSLPDSFPDSLPDSLRWLWRDYPGVKNNQTAKSE